eukprot:3007819-Ditylum_brightwellii.AAC.1
MATVLHPLHVHVNGDQFKDADWVDFYCDITEEIPADIPEPLGNSIQMTAWFNSDHAYSKYQNTVEVSTFGADFIAGHTCLETVEGLRFKLRMFGIPIDGSTCTMCDNSSVVNSAQRPESLLNKKHLSICWYRIRKVCVAGFICVGNIESKKNLSNLFTKLLFNGAMYDLLSGIVLMSRIGLRDVEKEDFWLNRDFKG